MNNFKFIIAIIIVCFHTIVGYSQNTDKVLDSIISVALQNNKALKANNLQVERTKANIKTAFSFEKTNLYYAYDQNNLALNNLPLKVLGVQQKFLFPTVYGAQKKYLTAEFEKEKANNELLKNKLKSDISKVYYDIIYLQNKEKMYLYLDSLYQNFSKASDRRFELGETNYLEKITAQAKFRKINTQLVQITNEKKANYNLLQSLLQNDNSFVIKSKSIEPLFTESITSNKASYVNYFESISNIYNAQIKLQKQSWLPDINLEYFQGKNSGLSQSLYGFQVGVAIPLLFSGTISKSKVVKLEQQSWEQQKLNQELKIDSYIAQKNNELNRFNEAIKYYNDYGKQLSKEIIKVANRSYKQGEIDFFQYILSLENATSIEIDYLENVIQYNKTYLDIIYTNY